MVKVRVDMTGWKMWEHGFPRSRIIIIKQAEDYITPQGKHYACWWCQCTCGNPDLFTATACDLKNGDVLSCGCLKSEVSRNRQKKYNNFQLNLCDDIGVYGVGYCHNTNREFYFDMDDYEKIKDYCWYECVQMDGYHAVEAWESNKKSQVRIHQIIVGKYCDHINRDPFNNRKYNLRTATPIENARNKSLSINNTSGIIGVSWDKNHEKWEAYIGINYKRKRLGRYTNQKDAIIARLTAEVKYFGEFAPQRHLFAEYGITDEFVEVPHGNS